VGVVSELADRGEDVSIDFIQLDKSAERQHRWIENTQADEDSEFAEVGPHGVLCWLEDGSCGGVLQGSSHTLIPARE
jgi:hypothetical protein